MDSYVDQAIRRVRAYKTIKGWSTFKLAKAAEVPPSTVQGMNETGWLPSTRTLKKLEAIIPANFHEPSANDADEGAAA